MLVVAFALRSAAAHSKSVNLQPGSTVLQVLGWALIIGGFLYACVVLVPAGFRGVVLRFGAVRGTFPEGLHFIIPGMDSVVLMETRTQKESSQATAASRDLQIVTTSLALNYHISPTRAHIIYRNVGSDYRARIIDPAVQESVKVVTTRYTAEELIRKRAEVKQGMEDEITRRLQPYDIIVERAGLSITNFDFSPEFNRAIEQKQVAQQEAEKQRYVLQQAELQKQTEVTRAEGKARAATLNAEALKVQGGALVIAREWIDKWDGKLPTVSGGGSNYIIDLASLMRGAPIK